MSKDKEEILDSFSNAVDNISEIERLKREVYSLKKTLEEYDIDGYSIIDDIEFICYKTIEDLKTLATVSGLNVDDSKLLDTVHKNLRMCRKEFSKKELKSKNKSVADLLKIVETKK